MDHQEQWKLVCEPSFGRVEANQAELKEQLERYHHELATAISEGASRMAESILKLEKAVYVDNGHTSIQTRLNDHDRTIKVVVWLAALVVGASLLGLGSTMFYHIFHEADQVKVTGGMTP